MSLRLAVIMPFLVASLRSCGAPPAQETATAGALRDSVGVNLHLEYDDTPYADPQRTLQALRLVGLNHVRDAAMRSGPAREPRFDALARAGVHFDLFLNAELPAQISSAARLASLAPGSVDLLEGPNEANHEAFSGHPGGDGPAVQAYQQSLVEDVRQTARLSILPVASFTYWPPLAGRADWANFHAYPSLARSPAPQLAWMRTMASAVQPRGSPVVCTETGYTTAGADSVSEVRQAALIPVLVLENFRAHVVRTYLYELFDEHPDSAPAAPDRENHFGLFRADGRPKPAALSLSRFMALLSAPEGPDRPSTAQRVRLSGRALRTLEIARSDGTRLTFTWWGDAQAVTRRPLQLKVPAGAKVQVLDLASGATTTLGAGPSVLATGPGPLVILQAPPRG